MADKKEKRPRFTSPVGVFVWPKLNEPDYKFNEDGEYGVKLALDPQNEEHAAFLANLDERAAAALEEMKEANKKYAKVMTLAEPYAPELDKDGEETGRVLVNFTMPAIITRKSDKKTWTMKPALFDANGTPLSPDQKIGGGSTGRVAFESWSYFNASGKEKTAGITKRLVAVQVLERKEWQGNADASAFGFDVVDGFAAAATTEDSDTETANF